MMADINTATFTGRLGSDIELKCTQSGASVCSFSIAVERRKGKDEESATVDWIDCVAWRSTAEYLSTYYGKGRKIGVSGRLQTRIWEDKNGQKRKSVELIVESVTPCDSKKSDAAEQNVANIDHSDFEEISSEDDLPF